MNKATLAKTYQKLKQREHVLKCPWIYVGSVKPTTEVMDVFDEATQRLVKREITFVPGLYKIFDEVLVNASDNKQRDPENQTTIKVNIDEETGTVKVWNNGEGIPVQMHPKHNVYIPELIFGFLNSGSNFNEEEVDKVTGGRHGVGAKLTNILSTSFTVDTSHAESGKRFEQTFRNNMTERTKPRVRKALKRDYTCITFRPDFARFGLQGFDADTLALFKKRVYDLAGCNSKLRVFLNDTLIKVNSFKQYAMLYYPADQQPKYVPYVVQFDAKQRRRWEVIVLPSDTGELEHVSFVNAIHTSRGGRHVQHVLGGVLKFLHQKAKIKYKGLDVRPAHVRTRVRIFINALINNPEFDSQTKETLRSLVNDFGTTFKADEKWLTTLLKTDILEGIGIAARLKAEQTLNKTGGTKRSRLTGIPKLEDANDAGGRLAHTCTLILTEGDSAKALAMSGLAVVPNGRDKYGVFPLRGKLLNVRDASMQKIAQNAEINAVTKILGMQFGRVYKDRKALRYGRLMIMTDQDTDGFHIKGLVINYIEHFWPSLTQVPGFLTEFITPLVRCRRQGVVKDFYNEPAFARWFKAAPRTGWRIKYYKGLGTSNASEAKEYFSALDKHQNTFTMASPERVHAALELAFRKTRANDRKTWLREYNPKVSKSVDLAQATVPFQAFMDDQLRLFSLEDCERSIPSVMDGLKTSQRKIIFGCRKRHLTHELKVAQLSGYITEHSAYHHGEVSVQKAIVNMAQTFMWSNNLNLLAPCGQFGTRLMGGKDAASARYISTHLTPIAATLFDARDDALLSCKVEDNVTVEPEHYLPPIPFLLVNGVSGIGTGFSSNVPSYHPQQVVDNVRRALVNPGANGSGVGKTLSPMQPWYRGFTGTIEQDSTDTHKYHVRGRYERTRDGVLITELPFQTWTTPYKAHLEACIQDGGKSELRIEDYRIASSGASTNAVRIYVTSKQLVGCEDDAKVRKWLKLDKAVRTSNMYAYDADGVIQKYESACAIIQYYVPHRLKAYGARKAHLLKQLEATMVRIQNEWRFLGEICAGTFKFARRTKADMEADLDNKRYARLGPKGNFAYLLKKPLYAASQEKMRALELLLKEKQAQHAALKGRSPTQLWLADLDRFEAAWKAHCVQLDKDEKVEIVKIAPKKRKRATTRKASRAKRRKV